MRSRIVFTGDFLRVDSNRRYSQYGNIRWLANLLSPLFAAMLPDCKSDMAVSEGVTCGNALGDRFYHASGMLPCVESWIKLQEAQCNAAQLALLETIFADAFVVAFELPQIIANAFTALGIKYIDFIIHPVRFMRQLPLAVSTNCAVIAKKLQEWSLPENEIFIEAGIAKAKLGRIPRIATIKKGMDIGIFACQTALDKSLIKNGRLLNICDFESQINHMRKNHDLILVKLHPYEKNSKSALFLLQKCGNTVKTGGNLYHLLAHDEVKAVYSLTSSASIEANYLGKKGIHFSEYPLQMTHTAPLAPSYMALRSQIISPVLWREILMGAELRNVTPISLNCNFDLRQSLNNYWGADILYR